MLPLTRWLLLSALVLIALLLLNAMAYRRRYGTFIPKAAGNSPYLKQRMALADLAPAGLLVLSLLLGIGTPYIAPNSSFAAWLATPYAQSTYIAWCFLASVALSTLFGLHRHLAARPQVQQPHRTGTQ